MKVFTVRDGKTEAYLAPFLAHNIPAAQRMLADTVKRGETMISDHPEDFTLWLIGEFDENVGELVPIQPTSHGKVIDLMEKAE